MLKYPEKALFGLVAIYSRQNDINIFVEDTTAENYYRVFLTRVAGERVKIRKVFQCQGRLGVIRASQDPRLQRFGPTFFLVDGDLFLLCGEKYPIPANVFVLQHYCFENLFICPEGLLKIAYESEANCSMKQLVGKIKIKSWLKRTVSMLYPLFVWYAVAMELGSQAKTVSVSGLAYRAKNSSGIDQDAVSRRIEDLKTELQVEFGDARVSAVHRKITGAADKANRVRYISAKNYLIPLLAKHLVMVSSFRDETGLTMRLAHCCDCGLAQPLQVALLAQIGSSA